MRLLMCVAAGVLMISCAHISIRRLGSYERQILVEVRGPWAQQRAEDALRAKAATMGCDELRIKYTGQGRAVGICLQAP